MTVIEQDYNWSQPLTKRRETRYLILHHEAASGSTAQQIHEYHLKKGWSGIAYHYYVRKSGLVYRGRPEDTAGAHTQGYNNVSIGVCFEGNFETDTMFAQQYAAGKALILDILKRYPGIQIVGHKELNATACPGRNFPLDEFKHLKIQTEEDEEEMDIGKLLDEMTDKQAWQLVEKANRYAATLEPSKYAWDACKAGVESGLFSDGNKDGLVDNPQAFVKRQEMATVLYRAGITKKK